MGELTGLWLLLEREEVVMSLEGRISWNVEFCLQGAGFLAGGMDDDESDENAFGLEDSEDRAEDIGVKIP